MALVSALSESGIEEKTKAFKVALSKVMTMEKTTQHYWKSVVSKVTLDLYPLEVSLHFIIYYFNLPFLSLALSGFIHSQ